MLRRIDLFMPPNISQYGVLHHFTQKFHEALLRLGVNSRILIAQRENPKPFLTELFKDPPDCTLSFNGLLPDEEGRFFCDMIRIPHVACIVDSPNDFISLAQSPNTIVASVDRDACDFFKGVNCKNVIFMPHGVEKNIHFDPKSEQRTYDVVLLASCIDYEKIQNDWKGKYGSAVAQIMDEAAETTLKDPKTSFVQAFVGSLDKHAASGAVDPRKIDIIALLDELEIYIRGKARVELVRSIKDARIDIFGSPSATTTWKKQLPQSNVIVHDAVPYDQALDILLKSKIALNSCAWIKKGTHERILAAMASGALVFTEENAYMLENFTDGTHVVFYRYPQLELVNDQINAYLNDEAKRRKVALAGREQVVHHHTWDHRAAALLKELDPILKTLKAVTGI